MNIPEEEIIIDDHLELLREVQPRKKIKNLLLISGGGISATFFSLGSVRCLLDNNLFNFDVISSVSGGTLLVHFIEQCYNQKFNLEKDWFEKYIRTPFYQISKEPLIIKLLFAGLTNNGLTKLSKELFDGVLKAYDIPLDETKLYTKITFEYNYLDADSNHLSDDHRDLIDLQNGIKIPNWYFLRLIRCCIPFSKINKKPAYDAGAADNNAFSTTLAKYQSENIFLIASFSDYIYKKYKQKSLLYLGFAALNSIVVASGKATVHLGDLALENKNIILAKYSTNFLPSPDQYHKDLFSDYYSDVSLIKTFYLGLLFESTDMLKVLENEGYIQMYHELKNNKKIKQKLVFNIPNPEVYNENAKKIYDNFKKLNVSKAIIKAIYNELKLKIKRKS